MKNKIQLQNKLYKNKERPQWRSASFKTSTLLMLNSQLYEPIKLLLRNFRCILKHGSSILCIVKLLLNIPWPWRIPFKRHLQVVLIALLNLSAWTAKNQRNWGKGWCEIRLHEWNMYPVIENNPFAVCNSPLPNVQQVINAFRTPTMKSVEKSMLPEDSRLQYWCF